MAKLFKTISLEDRWKASNLDNGPIIPPSTVNQGSTQISPAKEPVNPPTVQIKKLIDPVDRNSALLKAMVQARPSSNPLPPIPFTTTPLTAFSIPFANIKFRSSIKLADRLNQPDLGTTAHLPQYFLADLYTNYIKITPFGIFNHTSDIRVQPIMFNPNQGGTEPTSPVQSLQQGGLDPVVRNFNSLLRQGTFFANGDYFTFTNIEVPIGADGFITNPNTPIDLSLPAGAYPRDPKTPTILTLGADKYITNPNIAPLQISTLEQITYQQGVLQPSSILTALTSFVITAIPASIVQRVPAAAEKLNRSRPVGEQGGTTPTPITFQPRRDSPILDVLGYELQRALAFAAPRVVHGSADIRQPNFAISNTLLGETTINIDQISQTNPRTWIDPELKTYIKNLNPETGATRNWKYDNAGTKNNNTSTQTDKEVTNLLSSTGSADLDNLSNKIVSSTNTGQKPQADIARYKALTYDQIRQRDKQKQEGQLNTTNNRGVRPRDTEYADDFINLKIQSIRDGATISFRAFLTSFSDSSTINWNDLNYVGRQDTLKTFKGYVRGGSVAFKVAAFNVDDLKANYAKLNRLIKVAGVGSASSDDLYIRGPFCRITIGRWFRDTPVVFNSIKYDIQTADYSWEIDPAIQMPHLVDVSLDFAVLGDINGKPLNASSNDYLGYRG